MNISSFEASLLNQLLLHGASTAKEMGHRVEQSPWKIRHHLHMLCNAGLALLDKRTYVITPAGRAWHPGITVPKNLKPLAPQRHPRLRDEALILPTRIYRPGALDAERWPSRRADHLYFMDARITDLLGNAIEANFK